MEKKHRLLIEKGIRRGIDPFDPPSMPVDTAEILISLMEGGSVLAKVTGEASYMLNAIDTAETMIDDMRNHVHQP
jgi:hypothetical protein